MPAHRPCLQSMGCAAVARVACRAFPPSARNHGLWPSPVFETLNQPQIGAPRYCDRSELKAGGSLYTLCMQFSGNELVALLIAVSFAAGLNVYATVATLGLLAHTRWLELPASLHILGDWRIIAAALALFAVEFFADKIPAFDLIWNALHTFIRIPVAALLAYQATASLTPAEQLCATLAGGMIAFIAHGGKTAVRAAVTPSPEPFSNIALSLGEDGLAIFLTWLSI